jgi:hypothetical protein
VPDAAVKLIEELRPARKRWIEQNIGHRRAITPNACENATGNILPVAFDFAKGI